jgi:PhzF family phenazine biosynthesis protein
VVAGGVSVLWASVFADGPGGGNPCPVVLGCAGWTVDQMQAAAARLHCETVFVLPPEAGGDLRLRYFVPLHEMEMCVHATVAAVVLLARAGRLRHTPAAVETPLGVRRVDWDSAGSRATVEQFAPRMADEADGQRDRVLAALRLEPGVLAPEVGPIRSVSTARPKLMVPVRDEDSLDRLDPDFSLLWQVCDDLQVTGFYPFTGPARGADAAARQFPRRAGFDEDPATGVAACALGAYLAAYHRPRLQPGWHRWTVAQGRAMGRPSLITAEALVADDGQVTATRVGGHLASP